MTETDERFAAIGGLWRFTYNPASGQILHGPTGAMFLVTTDGLHFVNRQTVPEGQVELLELGALETVRREAERDPAHRFRWLCATGREPVS
jgi:hypothetical protein